ncbi:MAG: dimethyladenosine transferase [Actinomycetia bacterium]|nr:dimethyladenosine transferase [Actinomycetes bacterium]
MSSSSQQVSVERTIKAPADVIFDILCTPARHPDFDGSGTVRAARGNNEKLALGSSFSINMKMGVPYIMRSKVVEFEKDSLIAWAHYGKHRWRYELEPTEDGTLVRETFDWSTALWPKGIELLGYPDKHPAAMEATLERLANLVEE